MRTAFPPPTKARNQPVVNLEKVLEHIYRTGYHEPEAGHRIILAKVESYKPVARSGGSGKAKQGDRTILFRENFRLRFDPNDRECDSSDVVMGKFIWILPGEADSKTEGVKNTIAKAWGFVDELPRDCIVRRNRMTQLLRWATARFDGLRKRVR